MRLLFGGVENHFALSHFPSPTYLLSVPFVSSSSLLRAIDADAVLSHTLSQATELSCLLPLKQQRGPTFCTFDRRTRTF